MRDISRHCPTASRKTTKDTAKTTTTTVTTATATPFTVAGRSSCIRNKQNDEPPEILEETERSLWSQHRQTAASATPRPDTGYTAAPARRRHYRMLLRCVIFLPTPPLVRVRPPECISLSANACSYNIIIISDETHHRRARTARLQRRRSTAVSQSAGPSSAAPRAGDVIILRRRRRLSCPRVVS